MLNKVVLVGRLTKDPELKTTTGGNIPVVTFTLAVNRAFSSNNQEQGNDNRQTADFISCVAWRRQAEVMAKYTQKGSLIAVDGRIQTRDYTDKDNIKRYVSEVVCDSVVFLDSKSSNENQSPNQPRYQEKQNNFNKPQNDADLPLIEDDLPF
ncbi:MAG: single-stranded DNA-binding protein [Candidatus Izemoplasmatales bacterium]|nr:single-stranded DNA-binding protein [bacterium]MDZ4197012.1 single-stranded DNA-binding protein [Candidatus Izemoplasmatales bacterium]